VWTRNEADDFRDRAMPSHTAISIRNISASEIKYAVMHRSFREQDNARHDRGWSVRSFQARTLSPGSEGAAGARDSAPPTGTFARAGQYGRDQEARTATHVRRRKNARKVWRVRRPRRRPISGNEKARRRFPARASKLLR